VLVSAILFWIAIYDLRNHRISNYSLVLLASFSIASIGLPFNPIYFLATLLSISLFTLISRCGFGDSKLAIIVLNFIVPSTQIAHFLWYLLVSSTFVASCHLLRYRSWQGDIAFAPAICGAVLALTP
jgi:Flp pilus assembly protein protease CpaA